MKKIALIIAIAFGIRMASYAEEKGGGLFQRGAVSDEYFYGAGGYNDRNGHRPLLPYHELDVNQPADETPVGGGIALMMALGSAYLIGKKRKGKQA